MSSNYYIYIGLLLEIPKKDLQYVDVINIKFCSVCNKQEKYDADYCYKCGTKLEIKHKEEIKEKSLYNIVSDEAIEMLSCMQIDSSNNYYYYTIYDNDFPFGIHIDQTQFLGFKDIPLIDDIDVLKFKETIKDILYYLDKEKIEYQIKYGLVSYFM